MTRQSTAFILVTDFTCMHYIAVIFVQNWICYLINTLHAHDAFMRHGYKSRIFVQVSTQASGIVSAVNAADAIPRSGFEGVLTPFFSSF